MRLWSEYLPQRTMVTGDGIVIIREGEVAMIVVGKTLEECRAMLCPLLTRTDPDGE